MSEIQSIVNSLLARAATVDPVMLSILQEITDELARIGFIVDPAPIISTKVSSVAKSIPLNVTDFSYELDTEGIILSWSAPSSNFLFYEIRKGDDWISATHITTTSNRQVFLDPIALGEHTYLIKSLSTEGVYSAEADSVTFTISALGAIAITASQVGNNVLLSWVAPTSTFRIQEYRVRKNGTELGRIQGTFFAVFESAGGTFNYGITAYDIAGNASAENVITLVVSDPPDFLLKTTFTSAFGGTLTNAKSSGSSLFVCINLTETYQNHFTSRSWASPSAQVAAGYDRWLSPFLTTASYKETFDCGVIFTNVIINLSWLVNLINGSFTIGTSTRVSDDGISWSSANTNSSFYAASVRYIEVTINFTGGDDKALLEFYNFQVAVNVKEEMDSGEDDVFAADAGGTVVTMNKTFKAVESVTITPKETNVRTWVYDAVTTTTFKVLLWNSAGARVNGTVSWKVRGII